MTQIGLELITLFSLFIGSAVTLLGIAVYGIIKWRRKNNERRRGDEGTRRFCAEIYGLI